MSSPAITKPSPTRPLNTFEWVLLILFAVALPLVEAPKNIFGGLFLVIWLLRSFTIHRGDWYWQWSDAVFLFFAAAAGIATANAGLGAPNWPEYRDVLSYTVMGWALSHSRMTRKQLIWLLAALLLATVAGSLQGIWNWQFAEGKRKQYFELHSVGHTNHSALYLGIITAAVFASAIAALKLDRSPVRWLLGAIFVALTVLMLVAESRGAVIALFFALATAGVVFARCYRLRIWPAALLLAIGIGAVLAAQPYLLQKTLAGLQRGDVSSYRVQLARTAAEVARHHPMTGVGPGNYRLISEDMVRNALTARGESYVPQDYYYTAHGHGLFTNTLAERGLLGMLALLVFLSAWAWTCWRCARLNDDVLDWTVWGFAVSGLTYVAIGGLFNTTLHHEHGMLSVMSWALLIAHLNARRSRADGLV